MLANWTGGSLLFLGTYSGGLIGASVRFEAGAGVAEDAKILKHAEIQRKVKEARNTGAVEVKLVFAVGAHSGTVRCVAASGTCLISGGSDETVQVYDISKNCEGGSLDGHTTDVHSVAMLSQGTALHVISGGADGKLAVYKKTGRDWRLLGLLKGHKKGSTVTGVALHSSGKAALSVVGPPENKLRLWDLVSGTCAVSEPFESPPLAVHWAPDGETYAVLFADEVLLRHATVGDCFKHFQAQDDDDGASTKRNLQFSCLAFISKNCFVVGCTCGDILIVHFAVEHSHNASGNAEKSTGQVGDSTEESSPTSDDESSDGGGPVAKMVLTDVARFDVGVNQKLRNITSVLPGGILAAVASEGVIHFLRLSWAGAGGVSLEKISQWDSNARVTCMASNYRGSDSS